MKRDITAEFLRCISDHLSSRKSCRKVEYEVYIGVVDSNTLEIAPISSSKDSATRIYFFPEQYVYPDRRRRKHGDEVEIVEHVIQSHFYDELFAGYEEGRICCNMNNITPGVYRYVLSFDRKKRQWVRVN